MLTVKFQLTTFNNLLQILLKRDLLFFISPPFYEKIYVKHFITDFYEDYDLFSLIWFRISISSNNQHP